MTADFELKRQKTVHEWAAWSLVQASFRDPVGSEFTRTFVKSPGAVGVVALLGEPGERSVLLVRQYRPPFHRHTLEIPAGMRDQEGEDPTITARRELEEEAGFGAKTLVSLGSHESAPGISNSIVRLFLATDLYATKTDRHGPEEQFMTIEQIKFQDALAMTKTGQITDGKTVIGLLMVAQFFGSDL
ncbi:MAG: NUDIX hydrolase [Actinomycetota bacterium]